jgi:plastocyanin
VDFNYKIIAPLLAVIIIGTIIFFPSADDVMENTQDDINSQPNVIDQNADDVTEVREPKQFVVKSINRKQFTPDVIQIHVGDTILWENPDVEPHSVSSSNHTKTGELYFNELVYPGETFSYTFTDPGTYFYGCTIKYHGMYGIIRVQK